MSMIIVWAAIALIALIIELATTALVSIWFVGAALVALILAVFGLPILVQILAFVIVSVLLIVVCRRWLATHFQPDRLPTNADRLVGSIGTVTASIDSHNHGRVMVSGQDWMAASADESSIPADTPVRILKISGAKLIVLPATSGEKGS